MVRHCGQETNGVNVVPFPWLDQQILIDEISCSFGVLKDERLLSAYSSVGHTCHEG